MITSATQQTTKAWRRIIASTAVLILGLSPITPLLVTDSVAAASSDVLYAITTDSPYNEWGGFPANTIAGKVTAVGANDDDASYIVGETTGSQAFTVANASLPLDAVINSVVVTIHAKDTDAQNAQLQIAVANTGGSDLGAYHALTDTYAPYSRTLAVNPFTGVVWTASEVNNWSDIKFGVTKDNAVGSVRVTELSVMVDYTVPTVPVSSDEKEPEAQTLTQSPTLTVTKTVVNDNGGTATVSDFGLTIDSTPLVFGTGAPAGSDTTAYTATPTIQADTEYVLSELDVNGYNEGDWYCSKDSRPTGSVNGRTVSVVAAAGENVSCTITNNDIAPSLTLQKQVTHPFGGDAEADDWKLIASGPTQLSGWGQAASGASFKAGTYLLSEILGPQGYEASSWVCNQDVLSGNEITILPGQQIDCSITNSSKPATIKVVKKVTNDNGGHADSDDWKLWANDTQVVSGEPTEFEGNKKYYVQETDGPDGYKQTYLQCWDTTHQYWKPVGNPFYAKLGHDYFCKIVNDDIAPKLTVKKEANPQSDHEFEFESDKLGYFKLDDDGDNSNKYKNYKTFKHLDASIYSVREQETNDWHLESIVCEGTDKYWIDWEENKLFVKLKVGDDVTCKFVNEKLNVVAGVKFNDVNGNSKRDPGEPGLKNWTITLTNICDEDDDDDCEEDTTTAKTDSAGEYEFEELMPGTYLVCEEQKTGWTQTYPADNKGCHKIEIDGPGEDFEADFGNKAIPQVLGETTTPQTLAKTGASASISTAFGLVVLGAIGTLHFLSRRKNYQS